MIPIKVALDVRGVGTPEPRGVIVHMRQNARAARILVERGQIELTFFGSHVDKIWLSQNGFLEGAGFRQYSIPRRITETALKFGFSVFPQVIGNHQLFHTLEAYPLTKSNYAVIGSLLDFVPVRVPEYTAPYLTLKQFRWIEWARTHRGVYWITNSNHTKQDALALSKLDDSQVLVTNLFANEDMFDEPNPSRIKSAQEAHGVHPPYLLSVATLNPRKNHRRLVEAWERGEFHKDGWQLVLVGHAAGGTLHEDLALDQVPGVRWIGYVSREELVDLYHGCAVVVYPSLYEGFGIPVVEGAVSGKPILTSKRSPMAESIGDGAVLIDPYDVEEMSSAIGKLILDESLRQKLGALNYANRRRHSLSRFAEDLWNAYSTIVHDAGLK